MHESTEPTQETFSIKVLTRHSKDCPKSDDPTYRNCNCRKQLYIYEHGKVRYVSAKTRSWSKAEDFMQEHKDARDPVKKKLKEIAEREAEKKAAELARRMAIEDALDQWFAGLKPKSRSRTYQYKSVVKKIKSWAREKNLVWLDEVRPAMLYEWHGQWSADAETERDRLGPSTQNQYVSHLHRFFKWAVAVEYLDRDPSAIVKRQKFEREQTRPLSHPGQLAEILAATHRYDENRYRLRDTPLYGRDLRAIFLLQRWTGIRLIDALMLKRSAIRRTVTGATMTLKTKKTGKLIKDRPLPVEVVQALDAIPVQDHVQPGYYFWSHGIHADSLTSQWSNRVRDLNEYLSLRDEEGQPMAFRSHMLRDTFAVELLLRDMPLEKVSELLTHDSVKMTEMYYAPWVKERREKLHERMVAAMEQMGASFTPASAAPERVM